ncbi:LLM class flavin-dependent oxidoreductase [Corynebacterium halotolerans]|uniref:Putative oxygenase n=1 Tax=Corynebacterium halotolerans YIM 70093 = DSM 44683 TaxID=1121362 RepID=M1NRY1_9CORY|nr:LLM class flavin-dependent oxidoreductase [Corynebacterium halotolerans]AGF72252.1 putative oxygenase [Corynebacterium halotolerans YIM 70093 = DSM 44683]
MSTTDFTPSGVLQFGCFFQGVNAGTVWKSPESGSQIDFESFRQMVTTAERGKFAAFFLGEGLRMREHRGRIYDLDVSGRPDAQTLLAAAAAITGNIGLVATQNTTYNDPVDLARRLHSLDLLSEGRAAWNIVTTDNAWTGANFRRGGYLDHADRYKHAEAFVRVAKDIWAGRAVDHVGDHYRIDFTPALPVSPQGRPVLFQAGASPQGRDVATGQADVIFSPFAALEKAQEFRTDIVERTVKAGRPANDVKIMPVAEFILADTPAEAKEREARVRGLQVGPEQAIAYLEQYWGTDLSGLDADGPLPEFDPVVEESDVTRGAMFQGAKAKELAQAWRKEAEEKGWSIRQFATSRLTQPGNSFVGSYDEVADRLAEYARTGAVDGFNISPWLVPSGLDDIVNGLVPRLQDRGIYPADYAGPTLRENLGLRPVG